MTEMEVQSNTHASGLRLDISILFLGQPDQYIVTFEQSLPCSGTVRARISESLVSRGHRPYEDTLTALSGGDIISRVAKLSYSQATLCMKFGMGLYVAIPLNPDR